MAKKSKSKEDMPVRYGADKSSQMVSGYTKKELQDMLEKYKDREAKQEQEIAELKLKISNIENTNLEEDLRERVGELNNIKDSCSKKTKNTVALQKLKYEKEINALKRDYREKTKKQKERYDKEMEELEKKFKNYRKDVEEKLDNSF